MGSERVTPTLHPRNRKERRASRRLLAARKLELEWSDPQPLITGPGVYKFSVGEGDLVP